MKSTAMLFGLGLDSNHVNQPSLCWLDRRIDGYTEDACLAYKVIVLYPFVCTNQTHPSLGSNRLF